MADRCCDALFYCPNANAMGCPVHRPWECCDRPEEHEPLDEMTPEQMHRFYAVDEHRDAVGSPRRRSGGRHG